MDPKRSLGQTQASCQAFTTDTATQVLTTACHRVGLDPHGATLIRLGENALFQLAHHQVVVRIARSTEYLTSARGEVAVSRWLADEGFPVARTVEDLEQPIVVAGHPVTFWHLIVESRRRATYGDLGGLLRDLHTMTLPAELTPPPYAPLSRADQRIDAATAVPADDREFLRKQAQELRDRLADLRFESPKGPVHGDAHVQNLMVDRSGRVILIDLERFSFDHPEWDLMVTATEHDSLGWQSAEEYADFTSAYGRDLRDWPGFPVLRAVQEFNMTTWLMQNVQESRDTAAEYARRIASLRDDDAPRDWHPG